MLGSGLRGGGAVLEEASVDFAESKRKIHATYAAYHLLRLGASHAEMQERAGERWAAGLPPLR